MNKCKESKNGKHEWLPNGLKVVKGHCYGDIRVEKVASAVCKHCGKIKIKEKITYY